MVNSEFSTTVVKYKLILVIFCQQICALCFILVVNSTLQGAVPYRSVGSFLSSLVKYNSSIPWPGWLHAN